MKYHAYTLSSDTSSGLNTQLKEFLDTTINSYPGNIYKLKYQYQLSKSGGFVAYGVLITWWSKT